MTVNKKPSKGGRPKLPDDQVRDQRLVIYLNSKEKNKLVDLCESTGRSSGDLLRSVINKKPIKPRAVPEVNRDVYAELGRIGNNVNQAVRLANRYGSAPDTKAFAELYELLHRIRLDLLGVSDDR